MIRRIVTGIRHAVLDVQAVALDHLPELEDQIEAGLYWFKSSLRREGGSSAKYRLVNSRFTAAYPETTGYWINTLYRVRAQHPDMMSAVFGDRIVEDELVAWLLSVQRSNGGFPGSYGNLDEQPPVVFNTGQILLGLIENYREKENSGVLRSIVRAASWIKSVQDTDGAWRKYSRWQLSSNTRTAWALLQAGVLTENESLLEAGYRNINYSISLQNERGYFTNNGFSKWSPSFTHTIAYAVRGTLEAGILAQNENWLNAALVAYKAILPLVKEDGHLDGEIDDNLKGNSDFVCLTGNCQLAIIGFKLFKITGETEILDCAVRLLDYARKRQWITKNPSVHGGILGSWPIGGRYNPYQIPNWAVKFFIDALLEKESTDK